MLRSVRFSCIFVINLNSILGLFIEVRGNLTSKLLKVVHQPRTIKTVLGGSTIRYRVPIFSEAEETS
jgi:hypothetical protein